MRILMTGATGLIGREVGKALAQRGDTLVCLVRRLPPEGTVLPFPATCHEWDHTKQVPPEALAGVDAVVHLAGEPVADGRWTPARKALIRDTRVLCTRQLVAATLAHGANVRVFVHGSASGYYGDRGDETLHAASLKGGGFLSDVVADWEAELLPLARARPELAVPVVRTGIVLARQGGALAQMLPLFRASVAGRLGSGAQWMSWIHLDDIVGLLLHALDTKAAGVLEGVAPQPVTNREFTAAVARALGVFENAPVPTLAIRALYGEMGGIVLESARIEPRRTLEAGYRFRFEAIDDALEDLLAPLRDGTWQKTWEQWVPRTAEEIWPYFCNANNLEELTPAFLNFEVLGTSTPEIGEGTLIDYRLKLEGLPLKWQSRIESWEPPRRFVDTQVTGPYALWHHTHEFVPLGEGTLMRDTVRWRVPLGWLGAAAGGWKVASYVDRIFAHRARKIAERFGGGA
jgi:uncharacterized protein (TIGR01777 family)